MNVGHIVDLINSYFLMRLPILKKTFHLNSFTLSIYLFFFFRNWNLGVGALLILYFIIGALIILFLLDFGALLILFFSFLPYFRALLKCIDNN
jgi:hypothetical protein